MEIAIHEIIRNVDVCTRYSSMQYLIILIEAGDDNISKVMERIFSRYYKIYDGNEFWFQYEYIPMLEKAGFRITDIYGDTNGEGI